MFTVQIKSFGHELDGSFFHTTAILPRFHSIIHFRVL